jgi:hypothetical protein
MAGADLAPPLPRARLALAPRASCRYTEALEKGAPSLAVALQRAICAAAQKADGSWEEPVHWAGYTLMGNCPSF